MDSSDIAIEIARKIDVKLTDEEIIDITRIKSFQRNSSSQAAGENARRNKNYELML